MSRKPSIFLNMFYPYIYIATDICCACVGLLCVSCAFFWPKKTIVSFAAIKKDYVVQCDWPACVLI